MSNKQKSEHFALFFVFKQKTEQNAHFSVFPHYYFQKELFT